MRGRGSLQVVEFDAGGLTYQLQDGGHSAAKGQRAHANEVPVDLIDELGTLLRGKVRKGA